MISEQLIPTFWGKVEKTKTCWAWLGAKTGSGYGAFYLSYGKYRVAHRIAWVLAGNKLVKGLCLDHLCRNRLCVNPMHLEQVTLGENSLRGFGPPAQLARRTHCKEGHCLLEPDPTIKFKYRRCKICDNAAKLRHKHKKKDRLNEVLLRD